MLPTHGKSDHSVSMEDGMIEWSDFKTWGWEPTESFQLRYVLDDVELTLMDEDMAGNAEIMVQSFGARKLSQRSIRFPLPVSPEDYDAAIATVEGWHSISLPDLKWSGTYFARDAGDSDYDLSVEWFPEGEMPGAD